MIDSIARLFVSVLKKKSFSDLYSGKTGDGEL